MKHWTVNDFMDAFGISKVKAQKWYDAWQCEVYAVKRQLSNET